MVMAWRAVSERSKRKTDARRQLALASKSSFERIPLWVLFANFTRPAGRVVVRARLTMSGYRSAVVIERFCQTRRFKCELADGAREAADPRISPARYSRYLLYCPTRYVFFCWRPVYSQDFLPQVRSSRLASIDRR